MDLFCNYNWFSAFLQSKKKNFKKILTAENALFIRLFGGFRVLSKKFFQKKACQNDRPNSELVKGFETKKFFIFTWKFPNWIVRGLLIQLQNGFEAEWVIPLCTLTIEWPSEWDMTLRWQSDTTRAKQRRRDGGRHRKNDIRVKRRRISAARDSSADIRFYIAVKEEWMLWRKQSSKSYNQPSSNAFFIMSFLWAAISSKRISASSILDS